MAEKAIPRDIVQVLWRYAGVPTASITRLRRQGFGLWGAPGWRRPKETIRFRDAVLAAGGKGLLMTMWIPCQPGNRRAMLNAIRQMGPVYRGEK